MAHGARATRGAWRAHSAQPSDSASPRAVGSAQARLATGSAGVIGGNSRERPLGGDTWPFNGAGKRLVGPSSVGADFMGGLAMPAGLVRGGGGGGGGGDDVDHAPHLVRAGGPGLVASGVPTHATPGSGEMGGGGGGGGGVRQTWPVRRQTALLGGLRWVGLGAGARFTISTRTSSRTEARRW